MILYGVKQVELLHVFNIILLLFGKTKGSKNFEAENRLNLRVI